MSECGGFEVPAVVCSVNFERRAEERTHRNNERVPLPQRPQPLVHLPLHAAFPGYDRCILACVPACVRAHPRSPSTLAGRANVMIPTMPGSAPGYVLQWARSAGGAAVVGLGLEGMPRIAPSQASRRPAALRSHFRTGGLGRACTCSMYLARPTARTMKGTVRRAAQECTHLTRPHAPQAERHTARRRQSIRITPSQRRNSPTTQISLVHVSERVSE